jgi:hypothetical protein
MWWLTVLVFVVLIGWIVIGIVRAAREQEWVDDYYDGMGGAA